MVERKATIGHTKMPITLSHIGKAPSHVVLHDGQVTSTLLKEPQCIKQGSATPLLLKIVLVFFSLAFPLLFLHLSSRFHIDRHAK